MIIGSKNYLFKKHPRQYALDSLHQMLPVLSGEPASTAWFGGFDGVVASSQGKGKEKEKAAVIAVPPGGAAATNNEPGPSKTQGKAKEKAAAEKKEPRPPIASLASTHSPQQNTIETRSAKKNRLAKEKKEGRRG
jgi:hypothetical protein